NGGRREGHAKGTGRKQAGKQSEVVPYQSGEVRVTVQGNRNPVVPLGLALNGVTLVEFPEGDLFFAVHPPENGDLVCVEKSPSMKGDHHLVLRTGQDLLRSPGPAASVTVQMRSGLNVVLWVFPAKNVAQQTHRCVISYDPNDIIAARKKEGLATSIGKSDVGPAVTAVAASDWQTTLPATAAATDNKAAPELPASSDKSGSPDQVAADLDLSNDAPLKQVLDDAVAKPKQFHKWTPTSHGISVSTQTREMNFGRLKVALIAVRNTQKDHAISLL